MAKLDRGQWAWPDCRPGSARVRILRRGLEDGPPNNLRWGQPMHPSPNIWRSSVIGSVTKYELTKKRCQGGNFVLK